MDCKKHKRRDNHYGVTWCIKCGRLFNKPSGRLLSKKDIETHSILVNPSREYLIEVDESKTNTQNL